VVVSGMTKDGGAYQYSSIVMSPVVVSSLTDPIVVCCQNFRSSRSTPLSPSQLSLETVTGHAKKNKSAAQLHYTALYYYNVYNSFTLTIFSLFTCEYPFMSLVIVYTKLGPGNLFGSIVERGLNNNVSTVERRYFHKSIINSRDYL
jgi:hypothetical protein